MNRSQLLRAAVPALIALGLPKLAEARAPKPYKTETLTFKRPGFFADFSSAKVGPATFISYNTDHSTQVFEVEITRVDRQVPVDPERFFREGTADRTTMLTINQTFEYRPGTAHRIELWQGGKLLQRRCAWDGSLG